MSDENDSYDVEAIDNRAREINAEYSVYKPPEKPNGFERAATEYYGENVTGSVTGATNRILAASVGILREMSPNAVYALEGKADGKEELVDELREAWIESGWADENGEVSFNFGTGRSIGPFLPRLLAILEIRDGIDADEACSGTLGEEE